jgi:excisionase family DNA binding protein
MCRWDRFGYHGGMKVLHLDPARGDQTRQVTEEIDRLLAEGKRVAVTVADEEELLSPQQVAERLGFSRQHVVRLIGYGELEGQKLSGSSYWKIPIASVLEFERRRAQSDRAAAEWSRDLDALGAPPE